MKQVFLSGEGQTVLMDAALPGAIRDGALVRNAYSLISTGTEGHALTKRGGVLGLYEKASKSTDRIERVWQMAKRQGFAATARLVREKLSDYTAMGYSCAGRVLEVDGDLPYREGDLVACMGTGFATHAEYVTVPKNLMARIPDGVSAAEAACGALACIAMQGIRRLDLTPGENVGVVGLGLIGQLCMRLLATMGYRAFGIDLSADRVAKALEVEGAVAWTPDEANGAMRVRDDTSGFGLDGVIVCAASKSNEPVNQAFDLCRKGGRVSLVGAVGLELVREKMYAKELELRMSCSYGPGRYDPAYELAGMDYPIAHARWTERRNLELFLALLARKRLDVASLITHKIAIENADEAYGLVRAGGAKTFGILLDYHLADEARPPRAPVATLRRHPGTAAGRRVRLGLIGVGSYAKAVHIPRLRALTDDFVIAGVASRSGGSAAVVAAKSDAAVATSDYRVLLDDKNIDAVLVSTRHAGHAKAVLDALGAGKHVFVEKPMAITVEDGESIAAAAAETGLIVRVGFNRRFSPFLEEFRRMGAGGGRRMLTIRVNVGDVGAHWSSDAAEGGRFLGEGVHFLDLANFIFGAPPEEVAALAAGEPVLANPNLAISLGYPDGGVAQILYTALGSPRMGKEYYEMFAHGRSIWCRDFDELQSFPEIRARRRLAKGDKGQTGVLREFAMAIRGESHGVVGADAVAGLGATRLALEIQRLIRTRKSADDRAV